MGRGAGSIPIGRIGDDSGGRQLIAVLGIEASPLAGHDPGEYVTGDGASNTPADLLCGLGGHDLISSRCRCRCQPHGYSPSSYSSSASRPHTTKEPPTATLNRSPRPVVASRRMASSVVPARPVACQPLA